ncbi:hypothetical protein [Macrococcus capreoli]|uniref:hypothetical protein n=1 Tax=Macrococcus capreoli TaxID=2982690 RepID=UPI0021D57058|nr:hypothetical protein [Macrococcus sp. TMW 2.2395]MCU7556584.1 hypothetical protein [Macrococcus sp. TMW 2.2395]
MMRINIAIGLPIVTKNKRNAKAKKGDDYIMAIKLEANGTTFTFDTMEEYEAFAKIHAENGDVDAQKDVPQGYAKVSYEGAKDGDYFLAKEYGSDITPGTKYLIERDVCDDLIFYDDENDARDLACHYENGLILRKIDAESTTDNEDEIKVGDKVEIIGNGGSIRHYYEIGVVGVVLGVDENSYRIKVDKLEQHVYKTDVKKAGVVAEEEPKEETFYMIKSEYVDTDEVKSEEFGVGADRMLLTKTGEEVKGFIALMYDIELKVVDAYGEHKEGDIVGGLVAVNEYHIYEVTREEFEAKKKAYLAEKDAPFKVGDIVTCIDGDAYAWTTDEALMKVVELLEEDNEITVEVLKHVKYEHCLHGEYPVDPQYFVKTTEEEFNAKHGITTKEEPNKNVPEGYEKVSFEDAKEGDYFLALEDVTDIEEGEKYELYEDSWDGLSFEDEDGDERELIDFDENEEGIVIRKVSEAKSDKSKFKVGDKVRVKAAVYHNFPEGTIGTVEKHSHNKSWVVKTDEASLQRFDCMFGGKGTQSISEVDLEHVVETVKDEPVKPAIKVGDIVKVRAKGYHYLKDGVLAKVIATEGSFVTEGIDVEVEPLDGDNAFRSAVHNETQFVEIKDLTLVIEEETYKIEIGDVVRTKTNYTDGYNDSIKKGRLSIVKDVRSNGVVVVEQRLDKEYVIVEAEDVESTLELVAKAIK